MLVQLVLGTLAIGIGLAVQVLFIAGAVLIQPWVRENFAKAGFHRKVTVLVAAALWMLLGQTVVVWLWAIFLYALGAFSEMEPAVYFALVSFTTVGFGDLVLGVDWRLLGALISAHGMISFGLATAFLIEFMLGMRRGR